MPLNRIVVLLTPVFAALAGWLTEWVAQHFPGTPTLDKAQLTALFIAGATYAAGQAAHWLHGWQKNEARKRPADIDIGTPGAPPPSALDAPPPLNAKATPPPGEPS
jgi:hypothetical protein